MFKYVSIALIIFFFFFFLSPLFSYAQTELTVTIRVGVTNLNLSGRASPLAQITVLENNAVIGTTIADSNGNFSKTLQGMEAGIHNIGIYNTDINGETTSTVIYSLSLSLGTETTLSNIIMPSTVTLLGDGIAKGDTLKISGLGVPLSTITIFVNNTNNTLTKTTTSTIDGSWEYNFNTSELEVGDRSLYIKISTTDGYQSESSKTMSFKIQVAPTSISTTTTSSVVTTTPSLTTTPTIVPSFLAQLPSFLKFFDIDESGRIEVREIFDVARRWVDYWLAKSNNNCDLNNDDVCNLIDFSVLMYYVGR